MIRVKVESTSFIVIDESSQTVTNKHQEFHFLEAMYWRKQYEKAMDTIQELMKSQMGNIITVDRKMIETKE